MKAIQVFPEKQEILYFQRAFGLIDERKCGHPMSDIHILLMFMHGAEPFRAEAPRRYSARIMPECVPCGITRRLTKTIHRALLLDFPGSPRTQLKHKHVKPLLVLQVRIEGTSWIMALSSVAQPIQY